MATPTFKMALNLAEIAVTSLILAESTLVLASGKKFTLYINTDVEAIQSEAK